jgi:hypothetical protein
MRLLACQAAPIPTSGSTEAQSLEQMRAASPPGLMLS